MIKNRFFWLVALICIVVDQITKYWVLQNFRVNESWPLLPGVFHLTYVRNTGAAFSLFSEDGSWLRWLSLFVSLALMAMAWFGPKLSLWEQLGYGFILGGAIGNGIDRFVFGYVVDFFDFRLIHFAVFNVADVCINIGIACLFISIFRKSHLDNGQGSRGAEGQRGTRE
ncbi:lipoprotein signal peptidase [Phormidium sp. LEGE 05292]|uniref:signal peptidase II n=1 Tax=[Phormidium] sp. LEGE 05292 TaxID=767427 RepID=UPI001880D3B4|nr:signal peptidase II [Phormidium sp. LEGE 05292]MBE9226706.1 lipoprotein signal peptidase [Phormidium sp. LEGE 05292]